MRTRVSSHISIVAIIIVVCASCPELPNALETPHLADVRYWAYQRQGISDAGAVDALVDSQYDLLVVDPTRTDVSSNESARFDTTRMVARLKASPASDGKHRKLVLAYLNIGEAEDVRWYWAWSKSWPADEPRPANWPAYILGRDPGPREGNYPVAYWHPAWKNIIIYGVPVSSQPYFSAMDEVIGDGFDGVYLDWVEAYEDGAVFAAAQDQQKDPAAEMITFLREIRQYAGQHGKSDFVVVQQNAAGLLDGHPKLVQGVIDAIAQEAIWFDGEPSGYWDDPNGHDFVNEAILSDYYLECLDHYRAVGLPVFDCEYAIQYAPAAYAKARAQGFIPYVTRTSLARLTTTPPPDFE